MNFNTAKPRTGSERDIKFKDMFKIIVPTKYAEFDKKKAEQVRTSKQNIKKS